VAKAEIFILGRPGQRLAFFPRAAPRSGLDSGRGVPPWALSCSPKGRLLLAVEVPRRKTERLYRFPA